MSYVVRFYGENSLNLWSGWPAELKHFNQPNWIPESGYELTDGSFYSGELTSDYINSNKSKLGIPEDNAYFEKDDYQTYLNENQHYYDTWKTSIENPSIKEEYINKIKYTAQRKITNMMGYEPEEVSKWTAKQINLVSRFSELKDIKDTVGSWTTEEEGEYLQLKQVWAVVKGIRNHSDYLEGLVNSGVQIDILSGWPV